MSASNGIEMGKALGPAMAPTWSPDDAFLEALRARDERATTLLFQRFAPYARTLLLRMLGPGPDVADLVHDVFVEALESIDGLRTGAALKGWLATITVHVARGHIRKKKRRFWLRFLPAEDVPEVVVAPGDPEISEAVRATYAVLARLGSEERIVLTLRALEGMELTEVAAACGVSLATIKRRLARAEERFRKLCAHEPALCRWLGGGAP